jgi:kynurenine formamidase
VLQYRAELDAAVILAGGSVRAQGLTIDVPHADVTQAEIAALLVAALGLRDVERVELGAVRVFGEHAGPSGRSAVRIEYVELSHVVEDGGTGTYLEAPRYRYEDGTDLAGLPLGRLADLPATVVRTIGSGRQGVEVADLEPLTLAGHAVLLHPGGDRHSYRAADAARLLVERGAALVGIDSVAFDDDSEASGALLVAGIPIVGNLTGLEQLPPTGARFTAAPPRISGAGTSPVRAFATMPWFEQHDHTRSAGWQPAPADDAR